MAVIVRRLFGQAVFDGVILTNMLAARGSMTADGGWPTCSVYCEAKPAAGNEEDELTVSAGAGTNLTRFVGVVRTFRTSAFPRSVELLGMGTLAYADEWAPDEDIVFETIFPDGGLDVDVIQWALSLVKIPAGVAGYAYAPTFQGRPQLLGTQGGAPKAFDWKAGTPAWRYVEQIDRATLFRTWQRFDGLLERSKMLGRPGGTPTLTLDPSTMYDGARGERDTTRTRNFVRVLGYDHAERTGPVSNGDGTWGANDFQGGGDDPATRHPEVFTSDLIESGLDFVAGAWVWDGMPGLRADELAAEIILDVNKEFVEASVPSYVDGRYAPGETVLLDALERLHIGEPMWLRGYGWEIGDGGFRSSFELQGGGIDSVP